MNDRNNFKHNDNKMNDMALELVTSDSWQYDNSSIDMYENVKTEKFKNTNLKDCAESYGYACEDVAGNGNCFYLAVASQLNKVLGLNFTKDDEKKLAYCLREYGCEHRNTYPDIYKMFSDNTYDYNKSNRDGVWAEDVDITALGYALNVNFVFIRSDRAVNIKKLSNAVCTLYMGYEVGRHYQSLIPFDNNMFRKQHLLLNDKFGKHDIDTLNVKITITTQEELKKLAYDLLTEHKKNNEIMAKFNLIQTNKNRYVKEKIGKILFKWISGKGENAVSDESIISAMNLFFVKENEKLSCGLNKQYALNKSEYSLNQFESFHAWEKSFMYGYIANGLKQLKLLASKLHDENESNLKSNKKLLIENKIRILIDEIVDSCKLQLIKKYEDSRLTVLYLFGRQYLLHGFSEKIPELFCYDQKENVTIEMLEGEQITFSKREVIPDNYNGFLIFNTDNALMPKLKQAIADKENRIILAKDIINKLSIFSYSRNALNNYDAHSAKRLISKEWMDLYEKRIEHEEEKNYLLSEIKDIYAVKTNKNCMFLSADISVSMHDSTSKSETSTDDLKFQKNDTEEVRNECLKKLAVIEDVLQKIDNKMMDYCSSIETAEKYIAEYELNPYFVLGENSAILFAKLENRPLYLVANGRIVYYPASKNNENNHPPVYLDCQSNFSYSVLEQDQVQFDSTSILATYFAGVKKKFAEEFYQILSKMESHIDDNLSYYIELLESEIVDIEKRHKSALARHDQFNEKCVSNFNKLESVKKIKNERNNVLGRLPADDKKSLNDIIMPGRQLDEMDLYDEVNNIVVKPDELRDENSNTLLHIAIKNKKELLYDYLLEKEADVYAENTILFGPMIYFSDDLPEEGEMELYADSFIFKCEGAKGLIYIDKDKIKHSLNFDENGFNKFYNYLKNNKEYNKLSYPKLLNKVCEPRLVNGFWNVIIKSNPECKPSYQFKGVYVCKETPVLLAAAIYGFEDDYSVYLKFLKRAHDNLHAKETDFQEQNIHNSVVKNEYKILSSLSKNIILDYKKVFHDYENTQKERANNEFDVVLRSVKKFFGLDFTEERALDLAVAYSIVYLRENDKKHNYHGMLEQLQELSNSRVKSIFSQSVLHSNLITVTSKFIKDIMDSKVSYSLERDEYKRSQKEKEKIIAEKKRNEEQEKVVKCENEIEQYKKESEAMKEIINKNREEYQQEHEEVVKKYKILEFQLKQEREERLREREERLREREENDKRIEQRFAMLEQQQSLQSNIANTTSSSSPSFFKEMK